MLSLRNSSVLLSCQPDGRELILTDVQRGTRWEIDPNSQVYGAKEVVPGSSADLQRMVPRAARLEPVEGLAVTYQAGETQVEMRFSLQADYVEVKLPPPEGSTGCISLPGSFRPQGEGMKLLLPIMQGMLWEGGGIEIDHIRSEGSHTGFSMAFSACLAERGALLVTAESRDDQRWWYGKDAAGRMWVANLQLASLGTMGYERTVRLYVTDADIVAVARQYRRKVIQQGRLKTWEEKISERPALERLFGALMCYIGYCEDDVDYLDGCRKLRAYGFERALLYPGRFNMYYPEIRMGGVPAINLSRNTIETIKALGYDMAAWSWLNEALPASPEEVRRMFRSGTDGQIIPHWKIDDQQWYLVCYSYLQEYQQRALAQEIPEMTWDHFDVLTCVPPMECHALDHPRHLGHPSSRSQDREWVRDVFRIDQQAGLAVSSENFNDAYSLEYDLGSVKALPQYGPWGFWPVPLTMLVYHDSLIHSWWEIHSYNNPWRGRMAGLQNLFAYGGGRPRLMAAQDALMGCPPDVFTFGAQYGYTGHGSDTFLYKYRFEDPEVQIALKAALPVARLHHRIGKQEMVHFKFLSEDGYVQESAFADGTRVVANFSLDYVGEVPGIDHKVVKTAGTLAPETWVATE